MQSDQPASHPRRILLAVAGLSPQIVTETLHALCVGSRPAFVPTELHLITTAEGAERARLALLSEEPGWFHRLRRDFGLPEIAFGDGHIHVVAGADGTPLADIRSPDDNRLAADFITEQVRAFTADAASALHVSIAGGRKTLGYYAGYALSLFGRPQDRLSHVLVSEPFESSWDFFYPTPYSRVITTRDNKLADTATARVTLAEIPFVSLRRGLPEALLAGRARFNEAVAAARAAVGPAELILDPERRRVRYAGIEFGLPPAEFALLGIFARHARQGGAPLAAPPKGAPDPEWARRYLAELQRTSGRAADLEATERALRAGMDGEYFSQRLSKLRHALRTRAGLDAMRIIDDGACRPRRYRLALPPEAVRFEPLDPH